MQLVPLIRDFTAALAFNLEFLSNFLRLFLLFTAEEEGSCLGLDLVFINQCIGLAMVHVHRV